MRIIPFDLIKNANIFQERLVVLGLGHVGLATIKASLDLGFDIVGIDDRYEAIECARSFLGDDMCRVCDTNDGCSIEKNDDDNGTKVCLIKGEFDHVIRSLSGNVPSYYVVMTREHKYDLVCLRAILESEYDYIGMMASKVRASAVKDALVSEGIETCVIESIHSPIGLKIGASTPEEIAVSVMAEIISVRAAKGRRVGINYNDTFISLPVKMREEILKYSKMILAVIVDTKGATPRSVGTSMVICEDGSIIGTIGGGYLEAETCRQAKKAFKEMPSCKNTKYESDRLVFSINMLPDESEGGMACGGISEVELFLI